MQIKGTINRLLLVILLLLLPSHSESVSTIREQQAARPVALRAARLLDVRSGQLINQPVVLVENERIKAVGANLTIPQGSEIIDLGDVTLLPGLIDAHTHITYHFDEAGRFGPSADETPEAAFKYAAANARTTLEAGFTTIRNLGAGQLVDMRLRDAIKRGELAGPRILASGYPLLPDNIHGSADPATRQSEIREYVRRRVREGADIIKVFNALNARGEAAFNAEEIGAAVAEAGRAGLRVAVHAHEAEAVKASVRGGCTSIEHGSFLDDEAIGLLVEHHTALVPTLYLPTHYLEHKAQFTAFGEETWAFFEKLKAHNLANARRARASGVWIVSGSDAVAGLHGQNAREPEWLTRAGLSPVEAIRAATLDAAKLLGLENQTGEIKAGLLADIIAVEGDPTRSIASLRRIRFVMKEGRVFKAATMGRGR